MANDFGNSDPPDHDDVKSRGRGHLLRDVIRKTLAQSLDARGVTEDTLRSIVGEVKLPRELGNILFQQADSIKNEVTRVVAGEVRNFLHEANLGEELAKILTSISFEIRTEIRFIPNDEALKLKPNVRSRVGVKSQRDEGEPELVETKESAVMDKAIRSSVTSLANRFLSRIDDLFEDEPEEGAPTEAKGEEHDSNESAGTEPTPKRARRPDLRSRAEAVASVGRATASKAAATAVTAARKPVASVTSKARATAASTVAASRATPKGAAAASRPQAVVRGTKADEATPSEPRKAEQAAVDAAASGKPAANATVNERKDEARESRQPAPRNQDAKSVPSEPKSEPGKNTDEQDS